MQELWVVDFVIGPYEFTYEEEYLQKKVELDKIKKEPEDILDIFHKSIDEKDRIVNSKLVKCHMLIKNQRFEVDHFDIDYETENDEFGSPTYRYITPIFKLENDLSGYSKSLKIPVTLEIGKYKFKKIVKFGDIDIFNSSEPKKTSKLANFFKKFK